MTSTKASSGQIKPRVAIIGAGVCGLGIGWELARAGCQVEVFERGTAGQGASWAAAGMLAAGVECEPGEVRLLDLNRWAQRLWPDYTRDLIDTTGIDPGYRAEGTLVVALTQDDVAQLRFTYEFQVGLGIDLAWLGGGEIRRKEPHLRPGTAAAVYSPNDHQVDNRALVLALKNAFQGAGGILHEGRGVTAIDSAGGQVCGLRLGDDRVAADVVVLAAGAWSRGLDGLPPDAQPPVRPVKGQMMALRMDPRAPLLAHVLWAPNIYMVPRRDGRLILGATVEEQGFNDDLTAGGIFAILEAAWRAVPGIEDLPIDETWVGFRPTSRDDAPILGPTEIDGLIYATGHHRNGILLTPVTAKAIGHLVLTGAVMPEIAAFGMDRFRDDGRRLAAAGGAP